jgi:hypothetical protein
VAVVQQQRRQARQIQRLLMMLMARKQKQMVWKRMRGLQETTIRQLAACLAMTVNSSTHRALTQGRLVGR